MICSVCPFENVKNLRKFVRGMYLKQKLAWSFNRYSKTESMTFYPLWHSNYKYNFYRGPSIKTYQLTPTTTKKGKWSLLVSFQPGPHSILCREWDVQSRALSNSTSHSATLCRTGRYKQVEIFPVLCVVHVIDRVGRCGEKERVGFYLASLHTV